MKKQKIAVLVLCLFLVAIFYSNMTANAVNNFIYRSNELAHGSAMPLDTDIVNHGTAGDNITWILDDEGTLTFSGSGEMSGYEFDALPWLEDNGYVKTVIIENGITSIGRFAFYNCDTLENVIIPESVTAIGDSAFYGCIAMESVVIPGSVQTIGESTFELCGALESITICEGVRAIGASAFHGCANDELFIPGSVQEIGASAFRGCPIENLTIHKGVQTIGAAAFYPCHPLCNVYYSGSEEDWDNIYMDYPTFYLTDATFHYNNTGNKVTWQYNNGVLIFSGEGEMPDYKIDVTQAWFKYENNVKSVIIENGITSIGRFAFYDCDKLEIIAIPQSVQTIGKYAFSGCTSLCDVYYSGDEESWDKIYFESESSELFDATVNYNSELPATELLLGDLNGSGEVDTGDATVILRAVVGLIKLTDEQKTQADLNKNGNVDTGDATMVLRIAVGLYEP